MKGVQLPLGVQLAQTAGFDSFLAGPNLEAVRALQALAGPEAPPRLLLFGPRGSGKSHLLQALAQRAGASLGCAYVPLAQLGDAGIEAIGGLEALDLVCLDDVDAVAARRDWAEALARLLDAMRAHGGRIAASAAAPPERLASALPDLRTRLSQAAVYGLKPLGDEARAQLLLQRARARGLELPLDAAHHLLARLPRDPGSLVGALDRLDRALLSAQRRLTLGFVQQWLRENPPDGNP